METIRTEKHGKFEFRLVRMKVGYAGVVNRLAGGQVARINGDNADEVWRRLFDAAGQASPDYFGFDGAIARFRTYCPAGFDDPLHVAEERAYKDKARAAFDRNLPLAAVLDGRTGLGEAALQAYHATNLLAPPEKMLLPKVLRGADADAFILAAARFAADGTEAALLDVGSILRKHEIAKWTIATYLPFLWRPDHHMFLKPEVTRDFATRVGHAFKHEYETALGIAVYRSLLDLVTRTTQEISRAGLVHRDNIDVQSFIWVVGKYAEAETKAAAGRNTGASA
jgi:hypothetical protein